MTAALHRLAAEHERPSHLGPLELNVTPRGALDRGTVERYAELGVDRLVLLPRPDVGPGERHRLTAPLTGHHHHDASVFTSARGRSGRLSGLVASLRTELS
jgi:hypothetical protein